MADGNDVSAALAENPERAAFRDVLRALVARAGFPHEGDVNGAYDAIDNYLGIPIVDKPHEGPMFDVNTGRYLGPGADPRVPADVPAPAPAPVQQESEDVAPPVTV